MSDNTLFSTDAAINRPAPIRLLVALSGGEEDAALIRAAHRRASDADWHWCAVYVDTGSASAKRRHTLEQTFAQVLRLGGETRVLSGQQRAAELVTLSQQLKITCLLVGHGRPSGWRFWRRPLAEQLARRGGPFDVVMVAEARRRSRFRPRRRHTLALTWRDIGFALGTTALALGAALPLSAWLELGNISLLFLGAVLASASMAGTRAAMLAAISGFVCFNVFFTQPLYSLTITDHDQLMTVGVYLLVAVVVGQLAGSGHQRLLALRASREKTYQLLAFSKRLAVATSRQEVGEIGVTTLTQWLSCPVMLLEPDADSDELTVTHRTPSSSEVDTGTLGAIAWSRQHHQASGPGTEYPMSASWRVIPLVEKRQLIAVVGLGLSQRTQPTDPDEEGLLDAMLPLFALALGRTRLVDDLASARLSEENERLRSALLSSVSHDLRTPLASIIGSGSTLRELSNQLSEADRHELLDSILSESERLDRYIQNLLDMTRLGHGGLTLERDWIALDDLIAGALKRLGPALDHLTIRREWSNSLPLLYVHPALIEQALINVIDNAARFSPAHSELRLQAGLEGETLWIAINDQGPGIAPEARKRVFDMFYTGGEGDCGRYGSGLGLAICRGMLGAHSGSVTAEAGLNGRGTRIVLRLPLVNEHGHEQEPTQGESTNAP